MSNVKNIVLTVGEMDFTFSVGLADYNRYINELTAADKVAPAMRFLRRTVDPAMLIELNKLLDQGLTMNLAGSVIEAFVPEVEIVLKKSETASDD